MKSTAFELTISHDTGPMPLTFHWIDPATFIMGRAETEPDYDGEDGPPFEVTLSTGFWMGKYPVTQSQWFAITGENPSAYCSENGNTPVENVSWDMAVAYSQQINHMFAKVMPGNSRTRLPTEAEWEYCCRTDSLFKHSIGNSLEDLDKVAWHKSNAETKMPVGQKLSNSFGIYDMLGNVGEWCLDTAYYYPKSPQADYLCKRDDDLKVVRGGTFKGLPQDILFDCGGRGYVPSTTTVPWIGFRLVMSTLHIDRD